MAPDPQARFAGVEVKVMRADHAGDRNFFFEAQFRHVDEREFSGALHRYIGCASAA